MVANVNNPKVVAEFAPILIETCHFEADDNDDFEEPLQTSKGR